MFLSRDAFDGDSKSNSSSKPKGKGKPRVMDINDSAQHIQNAPTTPAERRKKILEQKKVAMLSRKKRQLSSGRLSLKDEDDRLSSMGPGSPVSSSSNAFMRTHDENTRSPVAGSIFDGTAPPSLSTLKLGERAADVDPTMTQSERNLLVAGIAPTFDPSPRTEQPMQLDMSDIRSFLSNPVPKGGTVQCFIKRNKSGLKGKMYPIYELYLENPRKLLLAAKKRTNNKTSNYLISMDRNSLEKDSAAYLGKVRSNFVGTEFIVYDRGINPKEVNDASQSISNLTVRQELGCVLYESNILGSKGPRKMTVIIPAIDDTGRRGQVRAMRSSESIPSRAKALDFNGLTRLVNKNPQWNESLGAYVLDFQNRVTMASVKNFQLIDEENSSAGVMLQFGRVSKDSFTMDVAYPLSPFQAFAICLTSFDYKLACE